MSEFILPDKIGKGRRVVNCGWPSCNIAFYQSKSNQIFCSTECRQLHHWAERIMIICPGCDEPQTALSLVQKKG